jgi:hypothetical protein
VGILTLDSSGQGPAIITYPDYGLVSAAKAANCGGPNTACGAANPGDTLTLWGTGLGSVGGDDASGAGLGQNMPNIPLTVWLGGAQAPVSYQGRSGCCVGLDQIVFTVPSKVPTGCAVPLVVQIGTTTNTVSNTAQPDAAAQSRVLQGLITGIGFVGGGAILKEGATVKGTATAASIWNAGVIGAAVAMRQYEIAILLAALNLFTLRALLPIKLWIDKKRNID